MTEADWLSCIDPQAMLSFVRDCGRLSERKARLFAVACCRRIWYLLTEERSRTGVEAAERYADGGAAAEELRVAYDDAFDPAAALAERRDMSQDALRLAAWAAAGAAHPDELAEGVALNTVGAAGTEDERHAQADLLRCLFGNPFRPPPPLAPSLLTSNGVVVRRLAEQTYEHRLLPSGHLDPQRLAVLADALEEAGADAELIAHIRDPGPHYRGCRAVDLVLER
jgi:hypothetical protein